MQYIEFISLNMLEFDGHRVLPWLTIVNVANPVRGEVRMPVLVIW